MHRLPRRRELLLQIGVPFKVLPANIPELRNDKEEIEAFVQRMALAKAQVVHDETRGAPAPVMGADTVVVVDGEMLGKPVDREQGLAMLENLSGRYHDVLTAVALIDNNRAEVILDASRVWFRATDPGEREKYWLTGEPADKAGAYAIQGVGAAFIERLEGSFSGVMGLPLFQTARLLDDFGHTIPGLNKERCHE